MYSSILLLQGQARGKVYPKAWQRAERSFYFIHTFDETNSNSQREGRSPSVNDIYANITI